MPLRKPTRKNPYAYPEIKRFEPSCLRHAALTNLAAAGGDAFRVARIAGHRSIQITKRYCHSQADAIEKAFSELANRQEAVTDGGHKENEQPNGRLSLLATVKK
jgi:integrase